jgi:7-cyano-7-deazaguanine synthase in queuosine biosynthesis
MPKTYASTHESLTPTQLPDNVLISIGRLVRACAEIEDLVTLYICTLTGISQSHAIVLLGRAQASRKLEIASYLAQMLGESVTQVHKSVFNTAFSDVVECRNAVAHGILLGITKDHRFAFLTANTAAPLGPSAIQIAISYNAKDIATYANAAHEAIPLIEKHLKLSALRKIRLQQPLLPHRKAQPQPTRQRKHRHRAQS